MRKEEKNTGEIKVNAHLQGKRLLLLPLSSQRQGRRRKLTHGESQEGVWFREILDLRILF